MNEKIIPYFARAIVSLRKDFEKWSFQEQADAIDDATRFLMPNMLSTTYWNKIVNQGEELIDADVQEL